MDQQQLARVSDILKRYNCNYVRTATSRKERAENKEEINWKMCLEIKSCIYNNQVFYRVTDVDRNDPAYQYTPKKKQLESSEPSFSSPTPEVMFSPQQLSQHFGSLLVSPQPPQQQYTAFPQPVVIPAEPQYQQQQPMPQPFQAPQQQAYYPQQ